MTCTVRGTAVHHEDLGCGRPIINLHGWPAEHGQVLQMIKPLFGHRQQWR